MMRTTPPPRDRSSPARLPTRQPSATKTPTMTTLSPSPTSADQPLLKKIRIRATSTQRAGENAPLENPEAATIEARSVALAQELGLVGVHNRARFDAFNSLGRHVYPRAPIERAVVCAMWCNWLFLFDDLHDEELRSRDDTSRVRRRIDHNLALLSGARAPTGEVEPLDRLLLTFRRRALELAGGAWLDRLWCVTADHMSLGVLPALRNWGASRTPPLREFLQQREHDSAVMTALDLIELAEGLSLPAEVRDSPALLRARRAATRAVAFFNDIVSFPKEVLRLHNPNNLVHVLQHERGTSLEAALRAATELVNAEARALETSAHEVLTTWPESEAIKCYVRGLLQWQRGNIDWSLASARYDSR